MSRSRRESTGRKRASSSGVAGKEASFQLPRNNYADFSPTVIQQKSNAPNHSNFLSSPFSSSIPLPAAAHSFDEHTPICSLSPEIQSKLPEWMKLGLAAGQSKRATPSPQPASAIGYARASFESDRSSDGGQLQSLEEEFASRSSMDKLQQNMFDRNVEDRAIFTASRASARSSRDSGRSSAIGGAERRLSTGANDFELRSADPLKDPAFAEGLRAKFSGSPTSSLSSHESSPPSAFETFTSPSASPSYNHSGHVEPKSLALNSRVGLAELVLEREKYRAALVSKDQSDVPKGMGCGSLSAPITKSAVSSAGGVDFGTGGKVRDALAALDRIKTVAPIPLAVPSHQPLLRSKARSTTKLEGVPASRRRTSRTKNESRSSDFGPTTSLGASLPPVPSLSDFSSPSSSGIFLPPPQILDSPLPSFPLPHSFPTAPQNQLGMYDTIFSSLPAPVESDPLLFGSTSFPPSNEFTFSPLSQHFPSPSHLATTFSSDYSLGSSMDLDPNLFPAPKDYCNGRTEDFILDDFLSSLPSMQESEIGSQQNTFDAMRWSGTDSPSK